MKYYLEMPCTYHKALAIYSAATKKQQDAVLWDMVGGPERFAKCVNEASHSAIGRMGGETSAIAWATALSETSCEAHFFYCDIKRRLQYLPGLAEFFLSTLPRPWQRVWCLIPEGWLGARELVESLHFSFQDTLRAKVRGREKNCNLFLRLL